MSSPAVVLPAARFVRRTTRRASIGRIGRTTTALVVSLAVVLGVVATPSLTTSASAATRSARSTHPWAYSMLDQLNAERRAHHLRPLTMSLRLMRSAWYHNYRMAEHDEMSHQLRGEAFFSTRMSNQGYRWSAAGENIGWSTTHSLASLHRMERAMYLEKAPNDGHRANILGRQFTQVGIQVRWDARHHKLWFTQDFGHPMG